MIGWFQGPAQGHGGNPKHPSVYTDEDDDEDGSESSEEDDDDDEGGAQLEGWVLGMS